MRQLPGGNGVPFDWRVLATARPPFGLSGGLNPDNIAEAVRLTGADLVDVSSGVETAPGVKDEPLISRFIQGARWRPTASEGIMSTVIDTRAQNTYPRRP